MKNCPDCGYKYEVAHYCYQNDLAINNEIETIDLEEVELTPVTWVPIHPEELKQLRLHLAEMEKELEHAAICSDVSCDVAYCRRRTEAQKRLAEAEAVIASIVAPDEIFESTEFELCGCDEADAYLELNRRRKNLARAYLAKKEA